MFETTIRRAGVASLVAGALALGCSDSPNGPSQPPPPGPASAAASAPIVASITPAIGVEGGGTWMVITGAGLQPGVNVTFDTTTVFPRFDPRYNDRIYLTAPPHAAGAVDIFVTNPGGATARVPAGFTFVAAGALGFDGDWQGYTSNEDWIEFTISDNALVSLSCWTWIESVPTSIAVSPPIEVIDGSFRGLTGEVEVSGRIVAESQAIGSLKMAPCANASWTAERK